MLCHIVYSFLVNNTVKMTALYEWRYGLSRTTKTQQNKMAQSLPETDFIRHKLVHAAFSHHNKHKTTVKKWVQRPKKHLL